MIELKQTKKRYEIKTRVSFATDAKSVKDALSKLHEFIIKSNVDNLDNIGDKQFLVSFETIKEYTTITEITDHDSNK